MNVMKAVLLIASVSCGVALMAQNAPTGAHPAAGEVHPAAGEAHPVANDPHPAKADAHPAAPIGKHPANPGYAADTNAADATISTPQPFTTNSINATASQSFVVPTFVANPGSGTTNSVVTNSAVTGSGSNQ